MVENFNKFDTNDLEFPEKNKHRALRRKNDVKKAIRKRKKLATWGENWYKNLHQYSKNKIHCSCNMCRFRPNWNPDAKPIQDIRNIESMNYKLIEYRSA